MKTRQQWFDVAWNRAQDKRKSTCTYLPNEGIPGCFIGEGLTEREKEYVEERNLNQMTVNELYRDLHLHFLNESIDPSDMLFLHDLQSIYDRLPSSEWEDRLLGIALSYDLTVPANA